MGASKSRKVVMARILFSYWAVRELGVSMTTVAQHLKISLPTVSVAVQKGERIVREEGLDVGELLNVNI
jgi:hypothetical protein